MVGGTTPPQSDSGEISRVGPQPSLAKQAVLTHRPGYFCLDNAFALIDGPRVGNVGKVAPPATLVFGNLEKWATRRAYAPAADARSPNCFAGASTIMARPMAIRIAGAGHSPRERASRNTMTVITAA